MIEYNIMNDSNFENHFAEFKLVLYNSLLGNIKQIETVGNLYVQIKQK